MMRYQYRILNLGSFNAAQRMASAFGVLGQDGWELVGFYDKASNWLGGFEKGFAVFKRTVLPGEEPDGDWAVWEYAHDVGEQEGFNAW